MSWLEPTTPIKAPTTLSQHSAEYRHLLNLIQVVVSKGVPAKRIEQLLQEIPLKTTTDAEAVASKLWTITTEEFGMPREFLIKLVEKQDSKEE